METKIINLLTKYITSRIDIKNIGNKNNNVVIEQISDLSTKSNRANWLRDNNGQGITIENNLGSLDFELKCINSGTLKFWLRGIDYRDKNNNRFPIYIDYINFEINQEPIIKKNVLTCHDEPYIYERKVKDSEIIKIHVEWMPFNNYSEYNNKLSKVQKRLAHVEKEVKTVPRLSCTPFGKSALNGKIVYRNWLTDKFPQRTLMEDIDGFCENQWFTKYLKLKFPDADFKINIFGPFGEHTTLKSKMEGKKVFFTGENLNKRSDANLNEMREKFDRYALDYVDFAMGYDFVDDEKYLRFPTWLRYTFPFNVTEEMIENNIDLWNSLDYNKSKDVVNVSSHDLWKNRSLIANDIENLVNITYGGRWRNNSNELKSRYNNNKINFIKHFKFDLCAENLIDDAYVTEKIFDSIIGNCIPLYAGGGNYLEPEVLNHKAILRWYDDKFSDNSDTVELFKNLLTDEKSYREFKNQIPLLDSSKKYIINKFKELEKHFERLIYD